MAQPSLSNVAINDDIVGEHNSTDGQQAHSVRPPNPGPDSATTGGAASDSHPPSSASRPGSRRGNGSEYNNGSTNRGTGDPAACSGTHNNANEDDNSRSAEPSQPSDGEQVNGQDAPSASIIIPHPSPPNERIIVAYYEEPLPVYTRYPDPTQGSPPANALQQTGIFCANCDPRAQLSRNSLLSDYLCGACWADFILWRNN